MNDSVDVMKREFMNQFNDLMLGTAGSNDKMMSPLGRMRQSNQVNAVGDHELRLLQAENDELK
jgi:hypothetical protein